MAKQWPHVPPGREVVLPWGSEYMRGGLGYTIYYNPGLNTSYYITGNYGAGWDVIEYNQPLCGKCWERYRSYRRGGR